MKIFVCFIVFSNYFFKDPSILKKQNFMSSDLIIRLLNYLIILIVMKSLNVLLRNEK